MEVDISIQNTLIEGDLNIPDNAIGLIIFVCVNGKMNSENLFIASMFNEIGLGTLRANILTDEEYKNNVNWTNLDLLTERLIGITKWCIEEEKTKEFKLGYFGIDICSAAVLSAAAYWGTKIKAVVSWNGRPNLTIEELDLIEAPTLLIVDKNEQKTIDCNRKAYLKIGSVKKMELVENQLDKISSLAGNWYRRFLFDEGLQERVTAVSQENRTKQIT